MSEKIFHDVEIIRQIRPLIHHMTNLVVMQTNANILLALGASPLMAHAQEELAEIINISHALVLNMGTLDQQWIASAQSAQKYALEKNKPIIFDPVGAGASRYRTETAKNILTSGVSVLRANASEILALIDLIDIEKQDKNKINPNMLNANIKGVDASHDSLEAVAAATALSKKYGCIVVISGKTDIVIDKDRQSYINYGSELFTRVTGMGCSATSVIAAFCAVNPDYYLAAIHATTVYAVSGQMAEKKSQGPGSFSTALLDALYNFQKSYLI